MVIGKLLQLAQALKVKFLKNLYRLIMMVNQLNLSKKGQITKNFITKDLTTEGLITRGFITRGEITKGLITRNDTIRNLIT